jgi:hypothetical protein
MTDYEREQRWYEQHFGNPIIKWCAVIAAIIVLIAILIGA